VKWDCALRFVKDFDASVAKALGATRAPGVVKVAPPGRSGRVPHHVPEAGTGGSGQLRRPGRTIRKRHCWEYHKAGGAAPFTLTTHNQAALAEVARDERIPRWFTLHDFVAVREPPRVDRRGARRVADWARTDAFAGDLTEATAPPEEAKNRWLIGKPDLVLTWSEFELPETGDVPFKYAVLTPNFAADKWVSGVQVVTGNPEVLHHANFACGSLTAGFKEENFISGYVSGGEPMNRASGVAFHIAKGSMLALQVHFITTGKPQKCKTSLERTGTQRDRGRHARHRQRGCGAALAHALARQGHDAARSCPTVRPMSC
ncbi:MAG: hypothetical protein ACKODX_00240, partial [Gemmata sp.]